MVLPAQPPQTEEEALAIIAELNRIPLPPKGERFISEYFVQDIPPLLWLIFWPILLPIWLIGQFGAKPLKSMVMRLLPFSIPKVDVYVFARRMEGRYRIELNNIGEVLIRPGLIRKWLEVLRHELLHGQQRSNDTIAPGDTSYVEFTFTVEGFWNVIRELWDHFWTRSIDVDTTAEVHIAGYETEDYRVEDYNKSFKVKATLPVDELDWHAW